MMLEAFVEESDPLMPTWFEIVFGLVLVLILVAFLGGLVAAVIRYRTTKRLTEQSGLTSVDAAGLALTSEHGVEAAYLAQQLRGSTGSAVPRASIETRLAELSGLRDKGLVSAEEYDAKRKAILDSL